MSTAWVAGSVRAVSLAQRRLGASGARALARSTGLDAALETLVATPYGRDVRVGQGLEEAQWAVGATLLWHLRVLAGWQPREGADVVRLLAAGFEIANVEEHLQRLSGRDAAPAYHLGTLETAWSRLTETPSAAELQRALAASPWLDPGGTSPTEIVTSMRLVWADRVEGGVPEVSGLVRAAVALLLLREAALGEHPLGEATRTRASFVVRPQVVDAVVRGATPAEVARLLPSDSRWVLDGVVTPEDLWRAEALWWRRVESEAFGLLRRAAFGRARLIGAAALLAVDAWRVRAALDAASWGGGPRATEVFDAVA